MTGPNPIAEAIERDWQRISYPHHPVPTVPSAQENPMTQPQQQPRLVDSLHAITGEIQANPLVARLLEHRLGANLTQQEADHITALIASLEQERAQKITYASQQQHDGQPQ